MPAIYLDNASTTFPKPESVPAAMYEFLTKTGSNVGRGGYASAYEAEELVFQTRQLLCELFHGADCKNVVFTKNITESLNIILKGYLQPGDHVLVSALEHNAVMRPLTQLASTGCSFSRVGCDGEGNLLLADLEAKLQTNTRAVVMLHASNVCGTILPLQAVGEFCRRHQLMFIVDSAQTAGVCPLDMQALNISALAFTGHKGLLGPQGIGGFLLQEELIASLTPLLSGGTGSLSHMEEIPSFMPDRFEAGTLNIPGIVGLRAGLLWLQETGLSRIAEHELGLCQQFIQGLLPLENQGKLQLVGRRDLAQRVGVVSCSTPKLDLAQVAYSLDENYKIRTRVGLHCSPAAHQTLGTYPRGTIRFSFGWWNTAAEVDLTLAALEEILGGV